jgi:hypothetical protein
VRTFLPIRKLRVVRQRLQNDWFSQQEKVVQQKLNEKQIQWKMIQWASQGLSDK